jgi:hypothetical protein
MAVKKTAAPGGKANTNGMTKMEAVTILIAERGKAMKPVEIREVLKKRFGLDISVDVASSYKKTLARREREANGSTKPAPAPAAAKPAPAPAAASPKPAGPTKFSGSFNKLEAVRQAMAKLGLDAGRQAIHDYIKKAHGVEMSLDHISTCRGNIRSKAKPAAPAAAPKPAAPKPAAAKPTPKAATDPKATTATAGNGKASAGISLSDIQAVKSLLGRVEAAELKGLIDVLSK